MMNEISALESYKRLHLRFLEMIAHDVKTPLDSLDLLLSILKGKRLDDKEYAIFFESVQRHVQSSRNLMQDLLSWAKIRLNGLDDQYECVRMKNINSDIIQSLEYFTSEKDISILDQTEDGLKLLIHVNLYQFILRNLLINGIKYSHKRQDIHIKVYHNNDNIEVAVTDNGIGISSDMLEEIFRFTGKTNLGTMNEMGTGIGLMLCDEILKQYGGKLWAKSTLGTGTTFYFSVPYSRIFAFEPIL